MVDLIAGEVEIALGIAGEPHRFAPGRAARAGFEAGEEIPYLCPAAVRFAENGDNFWFIYRLQATAQGYEGGVFVLRWEVVVGVEINGHRRQVGRDLHRGPHHALYIQGVLVGKWKNFVAVLADGEVNRRPIAIGQGPAVKPPILYHGYCLAAGESLPGRGR